MDEALKVRKGERIALVGGGGKTSLASNLVATARARGWTSLFTTTTKVLPPQERGPTFVVEEEGPADLSWLRQQLLQQGHLFLVRCWLQEWDDTPAGRQQKLAGFAPERVDRLGEALQPDLLIVEADGSRHRPFKAPAAYEPVIPTGTTLLVIMAGLSVLGRPLEASWVHRPERVAQLAQVPLGAPVDAAVIASVLAHPQGGRKGARPSARVVAVLTQATAERRFRGREVARRLLATGDIERVVLADMDDHAAVAEVWPSTVRGVSQGGTHPQLGVIAVVLAAGRAQRMGRNKLLLPLAGKPLLAYAVDAALGSRADSVAVVLGAEAEVVRAALETRPVQFLYNRRWTEGQSTSLHAAVTRLPDTGGILFLAGDMPFVSPAHLDRLIERFQAGKTVVWSGSASPYLESSSHRIPALFGRDSFPALRRLQGDMGGRALAGMFDEEMVAAAPDPPLLWDVDTAEAYERAGQWLEEQQGS